jgi:uncharacterized protein (DUF1015 family)
VARFEPFPGLRYNTDRVDLADVTGPPYDVIDREERDRLAASNPHHVVRIDVPVHDEGTDPYATACGLIDEWSEEGTLITDSPSLYVYGMDFADDAGVARQTLGVIGALELNRPGEGDILPHERTTPKARSDRLAMLRSCRANLSAVWGLSLATGLGELCKRPEEPLGDWKDDDGVRHRLWRVADPEAVRVLSDAVASAPVVIADGHHRYETSLAYQDERREAADGAPGSYDLTMTYVVELAEDQLTVRPIHRLLSGLPAGFDVVAALDPCFEVTPHEGGDHTVPAAMEAEGRLGLMTPSGRWLLRPRPEAMAGVRDLDSSRLDRALESFPEHVTRFQDGIDTVRAAVDRGDSIAAVLLRPAPVRQIIDVAHGGDRMPPKTTFFHPKPRTGLVFRVLD